MTAGQGKRAGRGRAAAMAAVLALALLAVPGLAFSVSAADQAIATMGSGCAGNLGWSNATPTINVGDTVTWSNCATGFHQLQSTSDGWCLAKNATAGQTSQAWSYPCKFTTPGSYTYWCAIHQGAMAGTITVSAPAPSPTPTPRPTPSTAPPAPSPSPSASLEALATSPSDSPSATPVTVTAPLAGRPSGSKGGGGSPLPIVVGAAVVLALGGGAFYWFRLRPTG